MTLEQFHMEHLKGFAAVGIGQEDLEQSMEFNLNYPHFRSALTLLDDQGETIALFGKNQISNGVVEVWLIPSTKVKEHAKSIVKAFKTIIDITLQESHIHRVQMAVLESHRKWAETLGFEYEGVVKNYHDNKDHYMYIKVKG